MLLANECVAAWLARRDLVAAYRVHEQPSPDHLHAAATILVELGIIDRVQALAIAAGEQAAMRAALADAEGTPASELVNALLLRAMQRAVYRSQNMGHYALGAQAYCHFTSPIRRYPDLMVHRVLKFALARERLGAKEAHTRACALTGTGASSFSSMAPQLCRACSERERVADAAARASQKVEVARFYANRLGERFAGTVSWVDALGAFVRIDETQAEGLIHMRDLGDEWFDLDERTLTLTGSATGRRIRPGDRVIVEIRATDELRGHLDLALVETRAALHW